MSDLTYQPTVAEEVRHFIWDRTVEDNPIELELVFSDHDIAFARHFAVMMYDQTMPYANTLSLENIPTRLSYSFLVATVYHLLLAKLQQLQRKDINYMAGNMTVEVETRRIAYLQKWAEIFKQEASTAFKEHKLAINVANGFACY